MNVFMCVEMRERIGKRERVRKWRKKERETEIEREREEERGGYFLPAIRIVFLFSKLFKL